MAKKEKDIFDKIMDWKIFGWFRPFYKKNKEMLLYLFFGVLTTAVSFVTAGISKMLLEQAGVGKGGVSTASTVISWICAVTFAYVTNRIWVFESEAEGTKDIVSEAASFYGGRIFTLLVEMFMMWLTAEFQLLGNKDSSKRRGADTQLCYQQACGFQKEISIQKKLSDIILAAFYFASVATLQSTNLCT